MDKYVIIDENDGMMLAAISLKRVDGCMSQDCVWTVVASEALHFEREEAEAVINFINDAIDWELAQQLHAELLRI